MARRTFIALGIAAATAGCGVAAGSMAPMHPTMSTPVHPTMAAKSVPHKASRPVAAAESFKDLDGNPVGLSQFKGRPYVLSFLSPSDNDSQAQVPLLIRLAGAYQSKGVVFVVAGEQASVQELRDFARQSELPFPVWQDPGAAEFRSRGFTGLPAHEFVDATGNFAISRQGFLSRGELLQAIASIL